MTTLFDDPWVAVPPATYAAYDLMVGQTWTGPSTLGACPLDFITVLSMARYSARIKELRDLGVEIVTEECLVHTHRRKADRYYVVGGPKVVRK